MSFARQLSNKYRKQLLNAELDGLKTTSKKVVHKTAKARGELIGNKVTNKIIKKKPLIDENSRNIVEIIIPLEKRKKISNESIKVL